MGPTLGLFFRPYVEPAACPFALHPFLETDLYLLFVPFPSQFFLSVSVTPGWPGTSCLSPVSLSSQLACVYLSPPTHFSLAVSSHLLSYLPLPAIYFASHPLVFLSLIASLFSFFPFSSPHFPFCPSPLPSGPTPGSAVCPKLLTNPLRLYLNAVSRSEPGLRLRRV